MSCVPNGQKFVYIFQLQFAKCRNVNGKTGKRGTEKVYGIGENINGIFGEYVHKPAHSRLCNCNVCKTGKPK